MCQLTYLDFRRDYYLHPIYVKWLVTANALEGHKDGFGYFLEKDKSIIKTALSATEWLALTYDGGLSAIRNTNGLYHCRKASVKTTEIKQENSHPFKLGNLVLAHNGTLELQFFNVSQDINKEMFDDSMIDSQKFLIVLDYYVKKYGGVLNEETIKLALTEFSGTYVLLIRDITTNTLYIAKDGTKELNIAYFKSGEEPCGIIINTRHYMLDLLTDIILDSKRDAFLSCDIHEFPKDNIFKYELGSFTEPSKVCGFSSPLKRFSKGVADIKHVEKHVIGTQRTTKRFTDSFFTSMKKSYLALEDIFIIFELKFGKSILDMTPKDIPQLVEIVDKISSMEWTEKRGSAMSGIVKNHSNSIMTYAFEAMNYVSYPETLAYPLIANGKSTLESIEKAMKESKNEKFIRTQE